MKPGAGALLIFGLTAAPPAPLSAAMLHCPPRLPGAHAGFEQVGPVPSAHWLLRRMKLFDGPPGEELKAAAAELAPDSTTEHREGFTSTWRLGGNEDLLMVCLYDGSSTYYRAHPHPSPTSCTLRNDNGLTQAGCGQP